MLGHKALRNADPWWKTNYPSILKPDLFEHAVEFVVVA